MKKHKLIFLSIFIFIFFFGIGFIKHKENKEPILGGDTIFWKNNRYVPISGDYKEKNIIAKGKTFSIFNVGDNSNTFIGYSSFLDNFLYVKETYQIPKNGEITTVSWGNRIITDKKFYTILTKILENIKLFEKKSYQSKIGIFELKPNQYMKKLYVAYNNCPIPTENKGYFGVMNGKLILTTESKSIWIKNELIHKITYVIIPKNILKR